jgi:exodeoxyribonuclease VIII
MKSYEQFKLDLESGNLHGAYKDVPSAEYHSAPAISKSGLDLIHRSPAHYKYAPSREPSRAMEIGTAIHTAILEPERFKSEYILLENVKDRRQSEYKDAVKQVGSERVLVSTEAAKVQAMQESIYANQQAAMILNMNGFSELSFFAKSPSTGVLCKCRFDFLTAGRIAVDVKKTQDAQADSFSKSIANYRYYVQQAFYQDVFHWATGQHIEDFLFLAVEEESPNYSKLWRLSAESVTLGRLEYESDLDVYAECKLSDYYPMPNQDIEEISLPSWKLSQFENELEVEV